MWLKLFPNHSIYFFFNEQLKKVYFLTLNEQYSAAVFSCVACYSDGQNSAISLEELQTKRHFVPFYCSCFHIQGQGCKNQLSIQSHYRAPPLPCFLCFLSILFIHEVMTWLVLRSSYTHSLDNPFSYLLLSVPHSLLYWLTCSLLAIIFWKQYPLNRWSTEIQAILVLIVISFLPDATTGLLYNRCHHRPHVCVLHPVWDSWQCLFLYKYQKINHFVLL